MNIFTYLKSDADHLRDTMWDVADNYSEWTQDRVFETVKNVIASVNQHIDKVNNILLAYVRNKSDMEDVVEKWNDQSSRIRELIEGLVMIHVDEPGFEQTLIRLTQMFENLARLEKDELFRAAKVAATDDEIKRMTKDLDTMVLS